MIDLPTVIEFVQERGDDAGPGAVLSPPVEALEDRLPGAITLREIAPRGATMEDPEDAVEDRTRIVEGAACLAMVSTVRQERSDPCPLLLGEFVAAHGRARRGVSPAKRLSPLIIIFLEFSPEMPTVYV
jgi:hypothetical protein